MVKFPPPAALRAWRVTTNTLSRVLLCLPKAAFSVVKTMEQTGYIAVTLTIVDA